MTELCKHQYKYLYSKMLQEDTIRTAWKNLRKGKTKRPGVIAIEKNFEAEVKKMRLMILNTKPEGYKVENPDLAYEPPKTRKVKIINERGKIRTAYLAELREQWYFHIIVEVLRPIVIKRIHKNSCGSIPGRGLHTGKKTVEKLIRRGKGIKYFLKFDIRHFYDTLRIDIVIKELRKDIADELFLHCIEKIYKYSKRGIMIGLFISPWLANYILSGIDTMIDNEVNTSDPVRYVDDIAVFSGSKKTLHRLLPRIKMELGRLRLRLKRNYQVCKFDYAGKGRPLDFMGFLFFRQKTLIRKSILIHSTRLARNLSKAKEAGRRFYEGSVRAMISCMGWFLHTDSYNCYKAEIKPFVNIGKLKRIVSKLDKEENHEGMEKRNLCYETI